MKRLTFALSLLLLVGCKETPTQPKVIYSKSSTPKKEAKKDGTLLTLCDLPVQFPGTSVLLFPVGEIALNEGSKGGADFSSSRYDSGVSYQVSNTVEFEIAGNLSNIKFQVSPKDSLRPLTDKPIRIERIAYLQGLAEKGKAKLLVYEVQDNDTNQDGIVNANDIRSLYVSTLEGQHFTKLTTEYQELIDWNCLEGLGRLYFRAIEDLNKNGAFDKKDKVHYYFIDLLSPTWTPQEYNPLP
ncbi:hypothetical protein [Flavobacterium sp.]|uniref:hypothetical protein n=1 Tax=Flavobacterium sp. TaxID=239 RepID=UPI003340FD02